MAESVNDFIAGWIGGAAGILVGSPLDVLKARLQAPRLNTQSASSWQTLNNMIQMEGVGSLFKGVLAPVMGLAGLNAILFVSYGGIMRYLSDNNINNGSKGSDMPTLGQVYLAGCGAGMACFLFSTPTDLIKIQAQISKLNKTSWQVTKEIFYRHGLGGFYQGGWITLIRDAPSYGIYFWVYEGMKRAFSQNNNQLQQQQLDAWQLLMAGGMAGTISWASIYPIDVIKSRLQMQVPPPPPSCSLITTAGGTTSATASAAITTTASSMTRSMDATSVLDTSRRPLPYKSIRDCVVRSYQTEGIQVFFRGIGPTVLRAFPVNAVTFWIYEVVMDWLSTP